jgi:TolB protein
MGRAMGTVSGTLLLGLGLALGQGKAPEARRLTTHPADDFHPSFTPDGRAILFDSDREGHWELYLLALDGAEPRRLTSGVRSSDHPRLFPDGRRILYERELPQEVELYVLGLDGGQPTRPGNYELFTMDPLGGDVVRLTDSAQPEGEHAFSPSGKHVAFVRGEGAAAELWLMNADGSGARQLTHDRARDTVPSWSPDGRALVYASERDGNLELFLLRLGR